MTPTDEATFIDQIDRSPHSADLAIVTASPPKTAISFQRRRHTWQSAIPSLRNPLLLHRKSKPRNLPLFTSFDDQSRPLTYYDQFWVTCNL
jgi:hypothetical protein